MKKLIYQALIGLGMMMLLSGCVSGVGTNQPAKSEVVAKLEPVMPPVQDPVMSKMDIEDMQTVRENPFLTISAVGEGVAPVSTISPAQAIALAKRAAIADAYRQLGEKIYGVKINAKDTVKDAALQNSRIITSVDAVVRNAQVVETSYQDGLYQVAMELKVSKRTWRKIFAF